MNSLKLVLRNFGAKGFKMIYSEYRPKAQTGDMIGFSGNGIASTAIKIVSKSNWSHIGLTICSPEWDLVLCWESTLLSNVPDINSGFIKKGVMLVSLESRIFTYDGEVGIRRIQKPLISDQLAILKGFRQEVKNRPYEKNHIELVRSVYDGPYGLNTQDLSSLFCSELFAEVCIRMGLINDDLPSNEYTPADFLNEGNFDEIWEPVKEIVVPRVNHGS